MSRKRRTWTQELRRLEKVRRKREQCNSRRAKAEEAERIIQSGDEAEQFTLLSTHDLNCIALQYGLCRIPGESDLMFRGRLLHRILGPTT